MSKKKKIFFSISYLLISYILLFICIKKLHLFSFSYDILFFYSIFNIFILLNIIVERKKLYNYIFDKRYYIGFIFLLILVIGKYNGSSIALWDSYIEPEYDLKDAIIIGKPRTIRSDEWLVSTPSALSQATKTVNFSSYNSVLKGTKSLVTLYPNLPSKDISILATPNNIGFFFLDEERAFSLSWYLPYFILFFATLEMLMILTKKRKLYSTVGAFLITLSPVVQWWQHASIPAYGALAIVLFHKFMISNSNLKKFLISVLFGYTGFLYIMCMYPAWQVPYAYLFLIMLIVIITREKKKIRKSDLLYLIPVIITIILPMYLIFDQNKEVLKIMTSTVYPGARFSSGGQGTLNRLFVYFINIFFPYIDTGNPCEFSQYICLFPLPLIYGIYTLIKKKKDLFIILTTIVLSFLSVWYLFPLPKIISKITLLYMSTADRVLVVIGYITVIELVYILSKYETNTKKIISKKNIVKLLISLIITCAMIKMGNHVIESYASFKKTIIMIIIYTPIIYLFIINDKKTNKILSISLILLSVVSCAFISPLNKGLGVFYTKPFSKQIQKIVKKDKNSIFLSVDGGITTGNYIAVNGGRTINSINYIPNLKLYRKLDKEKKYEKVYNRYEHVAVNLTDKKTSFKLVQDDFIIINLSYDDVCKINTDYIVSNKNLEKYEKVYGKYNLNIYKTNCKN